MVAVAERYPSIGIVGAYALAGEQVAWTGLPYPSTFVPGREICRRHLLDGLYVFGSANAVLYRADLVRSRDPFYNEANIHADTEVCFALLNTADFGFVQQVLTFTRVRPLSLSTASEDLGTNFAGMLQVLARHASDYLNPVECQNRLNRHLSEYYAFLGENIFLGRERAFWNYHRRELTQAGVGFSRCGLAIGILATLCRVALRPRAALARLRRDREHRGGTMRNGNLKEKSSIVQ